MPLGLALDMTYKNKIKKRNQMTFPFQWLTLLLAVKFSRHKIHYTEEEADNMQEGTSEP